MNKNPVQEKINNLIFGLVASVTFLTPFFFLTTTSEYFEFNKMYFFIVTTVAIMLLWCAKMIVGKSVNIAKSPLDFSLLLIMVSFALSTLTSLDKTSSLFGSYGRWFPSFFGFAALYFFYYASSTNINSARKLRVILWTLTLGSVIPAFMGLLNYFGLVIPFLNMFNQKGFLLSGSSINLSAVVFIGSVISAMFAVNLKSPAKKAVMSIIFLVDFIALTIFGGIFFVIVAVAIVAFAFAKSPNEIINKSKSYMFPVFGAVLTFTVLFFLIPQTKSVLQRNFSKEIVPSISESWIISSTTLRDFPIFGSGVSTFYLNYPRYKTLSENYTPTWNFNFDKPANEIFNIISTLGIFGLIAYGALFMAVIRMCIRSINVNDAYKGLSITISAGVIASLAVMFLAYSSFQSAFLTFALLGMLTAESAINTNKSWSKLAVISLESKTQGEEGSIIETQLILQKEIFQYIVALPIVALSAFGMYQVYMQYLPEYYVGKAIQAAARQDVSQAYDYQVKAISVNPQRSQYHRLYANTNLVLAQSLTSKQQLTDQEKTTAQNLLAQALRNIKFATETLNPLDSANWQTRAEIYGFLIPAAKDADQFAIQAYNTAIQLDPTNPVLRVELGGVYFGKEDYLSAGNMFKQAVNLKSDYANARYNLAYSLIKLKSYDDAKTELQAVQNLVQKDSADYNKVTTDLDQLDKLIAQVAGASTQSKPSVESIESAGQTSPTATAAPQQPLTKPTVQGTSPTPTEVKPKP